LYNANLTVEAQQDILDALLYHQKISENLKYKFIAALEKRLNDIKLFPQAYGYRCENLRAANLKRFKYLIYFTVDESLNTIKVFAVLHGAQNPATLIGRLK